MRKPIIALALSACLLPVMAQQEAQALRFRQPTSFYNYEMLSVHRQGLSRQHRLSSALQSPDSLNAYTANARKRLTALAGTLPDRTPIKAKVVGKYRTSDFTLEKVIFQSAPGRYVTAHLFLPLDVSKPVPACVEMCGHGLNGKGDGSFLAEMMAANGIAVMVVDPISQGERQQTIDSNGRNLTRGVTTEHTLLAPAYMLLGSNLAAQEYFDNSRAIDYLLTRKEIDGQHVGCYGFSGGGTQAAYLIGLDPRIQAGCVGLFFSSRERTLETLGPSDGCQWMPYEGSNGIEIADMALMNAPKPFLVLDGKYDFVDHFGALLGLDELRRAYTLLGCPDRVESYFAEDGHATPPDVCRHMVAFFRKWLCNSDAPIKTVNPWRCPAPLCTAKGQVNLEFDDARSTMEACCQAMDNLQARREAFCHKPLAEIRSTIQALLGIDTDRLAPVEAVETGQRELRDNKEQRFQLNRKGEYPVPVVVRTPDRLPSRAPIVVHLHDGGKAELLNERGRSDEVNLGQVDVYADPVGIGESADLKAQNLAKYWNATYRASVTALHAGRPLMGQRVIDVLSILDFLDSTLGPDHGAVTIEADGECALAAMHAAVLDNRIAKVRVTRSLKTWRTYLENPLQYDMMPNVLVGVLQYYDLPDLVTLSKGRISYAD
jgi:hypothetical protein